MPTEPERWGDLAADGRLVAALDQADAGMTYAAAEAGTVHDKRNWSNRFADAAARMLAGFVGDAMQALRAPSDLDLFPTGAGTAERPVVLGEGSRKRIDVAVVHRLGGLRIDFSLKGLNFRDHRGDHYDKNLTGRTYELEDELRQVRRLQPAAFVFALYWLPLPAAGDKASGPSSLARTVLHLRARVHKGAPGTARDPGRLDGAGVALYAPGDVPLTATEQVARGAVRGLDVLTDPPRRGRPKLETTVTLEGLVFRWTRLYLDAVGVAEPDWAEPEADRP
jgi:hypothetical protein